VLGARTEKDAQLGALFAGLLKILPLFLMVLPGVFGYVLYHELIGEQANQTLPVLITQLVPTGVRGIIAAALLAALMSTIAAALNSTGTLVAKDIAKHVRPDLSDEAQVRVGRISAVVVMLLAMLWSTQGGRFGSIFEAINKMPAQFIAPPIATVLLWGVFWRRGTRQAGIFTLALGFGGGLILFVIDLGLGSSAASSGSPRACKYPS
jgi:SSS family solute:Na+ symporter